MAETVYSLLDADARNWWANKRDRERGDVAGARQRERESIRNSIQALREAREGGYLTIGRGGHTLHRYDNRSGSASTQGYEQNLEGTTGKCCLLLGIPIIDSTTIPDSIIAQTCSLPMGKRNLEMCDAPPWGGMSFAPLPVVAAAYEALGATLYNIEPDREALKHLRGFKAWEAKAIRSFSSGDEGGLFQAMQASREEKSAD